MLDVQGASFVLSDAVSIQIQGGGCRYARPPSRRVVRCVLESDDQTLFGSFALGDGNDTAAVRLPKATPFQLWFGAGSGNDHVTVFSPAGGSYDGDIRLGPGSDLFYGGAGAERAGGDAGNDTLHGRGGNDNLRGGSGFDRLFGGPGNDVLDGVLRETRFG